MTYPNPLISPAGDLTKAEIVNDANLNVVNRNRSLHNQAKKAVKTAESYYCATPANWDGSNPPNTQDLALDSLAGSIANLVQKSVLVSWSQTAGMGALTLPAKAVVTKVIADVQVAVTGAAVSCKLSVGATDITAAAITTTSIAALDGTAAAPVKLSASGAVTITFDDTTTAGKIQFMVQYYVSSDVA